MTNNTSLGKFTQVIPPFMRYAEDKVSKLQKLYEDAIQEFNSLVIYFSVSSSKAKNVEPGEFFRIIQEFVVLICKKEIITPIRKGPSFIIVPKQ